MFLMVSFLLLPINAAAIVVMSSKAKSGDGQPRIHKGMKLADLKEEAIVRGLSGKSLPKKKADLLEQLVEGTICLTESTEWKAFVALKDEMESERKQLQGRILQEKHRKLQEDAAKFETLRQKEFDSQQVHHMYSYPRVHHCNLALTNKLLKDGTPRSSVKACIFCFQSHGVYSCQECDFDICQTCFDNKNEEPSEKKKRKVAKGMANKSVKRTTRDILNYETDEDEQNDGRETEWNKEQFTKTVMDPPKQSQDRKGKLGFTVWYSSGYPSDGWHSYEGPPTKEFDSTWKSADEANLRAKYRFYWGNCWGNEPHELFDRYETEVDEEVVNGLVTRHVCPPDSEEWTVGVVPDVAFEYLDNAAARRDYEDHDEDEF